ncbi:nSTAND1 domain-containing NTPase [Crossiella sp. NPDC003009]
MPRREKALDGEPGALLEFAADLRKLREKAGSLPYREMSRSALYSPTVLSQAAAGRRLPTLAVTLAYARACGGDQVEWQARWHEVAAELAPSRSPAEEMPEEQAAPYVGLTAFQPSDSKRFFGREELIAELLDRTTRKRLLGVFGASGSGKSSLLRAGLIAAKAKSGMPVLLCTPGPHPLEEIALRLAALTGESAATLRAEFAADPRNLHLRVRQALSGQPENTELLLVVDQFEEVFTLCEQDQERAAFIKAVVLAATAPTSRTRVVLGVRADFYGHCGQHPELVAALRDAQLLVGPMTAEELRQAITGPAVRAGHTVETALVTQLIAEAAGRAAVLPLLSHALLETWRRRRGTRLTLAGYGETGGIRHALARTAEGVHGGLDANGQRVARQLFLRLTALGQGTEDTRRRIRRAELDEDPATTAVLEALAAARLLTVDRDTVELAHEALIRCWPRLRDWLAEDREGLRTHRQLTEAADAWVALDRDPGALYRGARLAAARDWAAGRSAEGVLSGREREFLTASQREREREQAAARRRTRRLRQLVALLGVLVLLTTSATVFAAHSSALATEQRNLALARQAVTGAIGLRATNPALSVQLGLAAHQLAPTRETRDNLLSAFATPYAARLTAHPGRVRAVDRHGRLLASAGTDQTVRLWSTGDGPQPQELATIPGQGGTVHFGPNGMLATIDAHRAAQLWDLADPAHPRRLGSLPGPVTSLSFNRDGTRLATGGDTAHVWDIRDPRAPQRLGVISGTGSVRFSPAGEVLAITGPDHTTALWQVTDPGQPTRLSTVEDSRLATFSGDGRLLAAAEGIGNQVRLWDVRDPGAPRRTAVLTGHTAAAITLRFSADGRTLASAGDDNTVRLWDITDPDRPRAAGLLTGHTNSVYALAFSPDGRSLASGGGDGTVRVTELSGLPLVQHADTVISAAFGPGGRLVATASLDHTVRLTEVTDPPRPVAIIAGHTDGVFVAAFHPDGKLLATASRDRTARLWNLADPARPQPLGVLDAHTSAVSQVAFNPDGKLLATASWDRTARLWDITDPAHPRPRSMLAGHTDAVNALAFSPDGRLLATAGEDRTIRLWDLADPDRPQELALVTGHTDAVSRLAFSPDGRLLASAGNDHTVRLWNVADPATPRETAVITGHTNAVYGVAFSPDGRRLATGGEDRTIRLWDLADPGHPAETGVLSGHTGVVARVAFSPDGGSVLTAAGDHTARRWETDPRRVAERICGLGAPPISAAEWDRHFPGLDYRPPCP